MNGRPDELHIASLVLRCRPQHQPGLLECVAQLPGAEVAAAEGGKLVVVIEAAGERQILEMTDALRELPHVLDCHLVYHHAESADELAAPAPARPKDAVP